MKILKLILFWANLFKKVSNFNYIWSYKFTSFLDRKALQCLWESKYIYQYNIIYPSAERRDILLTTVVLVLSRQGCKCDIYEETVDGNQPVGL